MVLASQLPFWLYKIIPQKLILKKHPRSSALTASFSSTATEGSLDGQTLP
ncbi:MAG: hypothetical protein LBT47_02925 [Deltaproteobacteria bacterium]|jgi:hypothetical protein|nr:hypothetical protein [Deltaproteobacteria bacterium]